MYPIDRAPQHILIFDAFDGHDVDLFTARKRYPSSIPARGGPAVYGDFDVGRHRDRLGPISLADDIGEGSAGRRVESDR